MVDIKTVEIKINVDEPALSEVKVNGEMVQNLFGIRVSANVGEAPAEVEFHTNGTELGLDKTKFSFFIKPHCPACGYDGVRKRAISVGETSSDQSTESTGVPEGTSVSSDSPE